MAWGFSKKEAKVSSDNNGSFYQLSDKITESANARLVRLFKVVEIGSMADDAYASIGFVCAVNNLERMQKTHQFGRKELSFA